MQGSEKVDHSSRRTNSPPSIAVNPYADRTAARRDERRERHGQTTVYVADTGRVIGVLTTADTLRPSAKEAIQRLRRLGVDNLTMLTGDNRAVARAVADQLGIAFQAELLPEDKLRTIEGLKAKGR